MQLAGPSPAYLNLKETAIRQRRMSNPPGQKELVRVAFMSFIQSDAVCDMHMFICRCQNFERSCFGDKAVSGSFS